MCLLFGGGTDSSYAWSWVWTYHVCIYTCAFFFKYFFRNALWCDFLLGKIKKKKRKPTFPTGYYTIFINMSIQTEYIYIYILPGGYFLLLIWTGLTYHRYCSNDCITPPLGWLCSLNRTYGVNFHHLYHIPLKFSAANKPKPVVSAGGFSDAVLFVSLTDYNPTLKVIRAGVKPRLSVSVRSRSRRAARQRNLSSGT